MLIEVNIEGRNMTVKFYPSMMCSDFSNIEKTVKQLDLAGVDGFHCDVMDGTFVENMTMGPLAIKAIKKHTDNFVDVHLMVNNPSRIIDIYLDLKVDLIYIHPEAERYVIKTLMYIKSKGIKCGLAINPDTPFSDVVEMLPFVDYVMVMTVNPGFAGQKFIESMHTKILLFSKYKKQYNYQLILDGAVSSDIIEKYLNYGIDGFILGTSNLFSGDHNYQAVMNELKAIKKEG